MKNSIVLASIVMCAMLASCSGSTNKVSVEVADWSGFRKAAVTYTFDDQCPNQFPIAVPLFDTYGFKMTLYPVSDWGRWDDIRAAATNGHEIGSHTVTHPHLNTLSVEEQEAELSKSKAFANEYLQGLEVDCNTIAYPYCDLGDMSLVSKYYIAGRVCKQEITPKTPEDYYLISSLVCGDQGSVNSPEAFVSQMEAAQASGGWCVFLLHSIDNDGGYSPLASTVLRQSLEYLDGHRDTYWVTTFRDAVLYSKERDAVSIIEKSTTSEIRLEITDTLDDAVYNYPLTIRCSLPSGWKNVSVKQNNETVPSSMVTIDKVQYVVFEAVPDAGMVSIAHNK